MIRFDSKYFLRFGSIRDCKRSIRTSLRTRFSRVHYSMPGVQHPRICTFAREIVPIYGRALWNRLHSQTKFEIRSGASSIIVKRSILELFQSAFQRCTLKDCLSERILLMMVLLCGSMWLVWTRLFWDEFSTELPLSFSFWNYRCAEIGGLWIWLKWVIIYLLWDP